MTIETNRLVLREMNMDDFEALYKVLADSDIMQHYPYIFDDSRVQSWIERNIERYRIFGFGLWAVCLKDTGEMIGDCGLTMQNIGGTIKPEIGYHIRKDMQKKGFAKEAASAVRDWTFTNTTFHEIFSYMKYTNEPSARTAMSWGCHFVCEFEDDVNEITKVYVITKEEWRKIKYREQAVSCVNGFVLQNQRERFEKNHCNLDEFYSTLDDDMYFGKVIRAGKEYELGYRKCTCAKVLNGEITDREHCECSKQSILYILGQLMPQTGVNVEIVESVLRGGKHCRFKITVERIRI